MIDITPAVTSDTLIPINQGQIGGATVQTVNARELHAYLEVGKDFSNWIKDRIDQYGFLENQDFVVFANSGENPRGGRPSKEYAITLDMAKELSMVERNQKGKEARQYFIECERRAKAAALAIPNNLPDALRLAADLAEEKVKIEAERDEAIRTKAQIGSKREAQAMAKASAAVREANKLRHELGRNQHHATVIAVEAATGTKFPRNAYVGLRRWCKTNGIKPTNVVDERFGIVKAWPAGAWMDCHGIDLEALFGFTSKYDGARQDSARAAI